MISHVYNGQTFKVQKGLSQDAADSFCALLIAYQSRDKSGKESYFEVERMPESATPTMPRKRGRPAKVVSATPTGEMPAEGHTDASKRMFVRSDELYAEGYYRVPCATCGEGIKRTGARGRAPKYHEGECRPESE